MARFAVFHGLTWVFTALSLLLLGVTLFAAVMFWRNRSDRAVLARAERLENVDLAEVMRRHLPTEAQLNVIADELPQAIQIVQGKLAWWTRSVLGLTVALLICVGVTATLVRSNIRHRAAVPAEVVATVDPLAVISGVWGWEHDAPLSCNQNPVTMTLAADGSKLRARFKSPVWDGKANQQLFDYDIVGHRPNTLLLHLVGQAAYFDKVGNPVQWLIEFQNRDTYIFHRSDQPSVSTGKIVRCG